MRLFWFLAWAVIAFSPASAQDATPAPDAPPAQHKIEWRLENPFRLFDTDTTQLHIAAYGDAIAGGDQKAALPVLAAERSLSQRFPRGWAENVYANTCYLERSDARTGTYTEKCADYIEPRSHWALFSLNEPSATLCVWTFKIGETQTSTDSVPCDAVQRFEIPYPDGAHISVVADGAPLDDIEVKVKDLLIVGLGDSFASGEGNPDRPVKLSDTPINYGEVKTPEGPIFLENYPRREGDWSNINSTAFNKYGAEWWDTRCHRSLYSHQLRAALELAVEDPQTAVTFLSFACTGAEIMNGFFLEKPVRECTSTRREISYGFVPSQFSQLSEALCQDARLETLGADYTDDENAKVLKCTKTEGPKGRIPLLKRKIDLVMMSFGGNDVGFVPIVADAIIREGTDLRDLAKSQGAIFNAAHGKELLDGVRNDSKKRSLARKYRLLARALAANFGVRSDQILLTAYPSIARISNDHFCTGTAGMDVFPVLRYNDDKVAAAENFVKQDLTPQMEQAAKSLRWHFAQSHEADFVDHSVCAANDDPKDQFAFPRYENDIWAPYTPSSYIPYASRQRWIRTPNDAFLIANMHSRRRMALFGAQCNEFTTSASLIIAGASSRMATPLQVFIASTYSGAFHPTAEGQARIADAVVEEARCMLGRPNAKNCPMPMEHANE